MKMYRPHRLYPRNSKPKEPSLYRSLCVSILCMFLSTVMLVGTTMAWFSDSLQTGVYTITSADFSTTVYYCTELSSEANTPNNWQRLNPSNTTLFGGGSLSSGDGQVAYLKLVSNSDMPLKYKFTLTASEENGNIDNLSLAGCQYKTNSNDALTETDLSAATPSADANSPQEIVFYVPAATEGNPPAIVYAVLKLTYTSSNEATTSNIYNFSLKLEIMQDKPSAQAAEPESSVIVDVNTDIVGSTPSTPALTVSKSNAAISGDEVTQQPADEDNSGTGEIPTVAEGTTGTSESGDTGTAGTSDTSGGGDTTVTENGSET